MEIREVLDRLIDETGIYFPRERIRKYENIGVLTRPPRMENNYRYYSEEEYQKIKIKLLSRYIGIDIRVSNHADLFIEIKNREKMIDELRKSLMLTK